LTKGQISGVIENDGGRYSIIKLIDTKEPIIEPVDENAVQIKQKVLELKRVSATLDWLKEHRAKAEIKVFEDALEKSIDKAKYEKKN
jgi:Xaa-Pro aminopeptidase